MTSASATYNLGMQQAMKERIIERLHVSVPQLRMYRVLLFFRVLEYNLVVSLFWTTMVRNFVYIIYSCHWAGALHFPGLQLLQPQWFFRLLTCSCAERSPREFGLFMNLLHHIVPVPASGASGLGLPAS